MTKTWIRISHFTGTPALALHPVGHTDRCGSLNNLANELFSRFKHRLTTRSRISLTLHLLSKLLEHCLYAARHTQEREYVRRHTQHEDHRISYSNIAHTEIEKGHQGPALPLS
ncbi:hypothetical protein BDR03DRAFT_975955, partial [Suillus americanus]